MKLEEHKITAAEKWKIEKAKKKKKNEKPNKAKKFQVQSSDRSVVNENMVLNDSFDFSLDTDKNEIKEFS